MANINREKQLIIGLDVPTSERALQIVSVLRDRPWGYKVGPELVFRCPSIIKRLLDLGYKVFVDLKWFNTPDVIAGMIKVAGEMGIDICNINLESNGPESIAAAVEAAEKFPKMILSGVTVLTSRDDKSLAATGVRRSREEQVLELAGLALRLGVRGLIASGLEAAPLRREFGNHFQLIVPGTRSKGAGSKDQKCIVTPGEALEAGADQLVIASQVVADPDPLAAYERLVAELGR